MNLCVFPQRHSVSLFFEGNTPFQEETKSGLHWVAASFHHDEVAFGNGPQLVRCHQRPFYHLQGLTGVILALAHRAGLHCAGAEVFGQHFRSLAARRKTAEDGILAVVLNDLGSRCPLCHSFFQAELMIG